MAAECPPPPAPTIPLPSTTTAALTKAQRRGHTADPTPSTPPPPRPPANAGDASTHEGRKAIVEAQARARGARSPAPNDVDSMPASAVVEGANAGALICRHCFKRFESFVELRRGCPQRLFHPGKYDSGIRTVWNGPDYLQYDAEESSWTCCSATTSGGGCRTRPHEAATADAQQQQAATKSLQELCEFSVCSAGASHGEKRDGPGSGAFRRDESEFAGGEAKVRVLIEQLGADVNGPTGGACLRERACLPWRRRAAPPPPPPSVPLPALTCGRVLVCSRSTAARLSLVAKSAQKGHYAMLRLLFECGARPELADAPQPTYDGRRPLYLALDQNWLNPGHVRCAWLLCSHGANPNASNGGAATFGSAAKLVAKKYRDETSKFDLWVLGHVLGRILAAASARCAARGGATVESAAETSAQAAGASDGGGGGGGGDEDASDVVGLDDRDPNKLEGLFEEARAAAVAAGVQRM